MFAKESVKRHCFLKSKRRNMFYSSYCVNQLWSMHHYQAASYPNSSLLQSRHFASLSLFWRRPRLADEKVNAERYIDSYLEYSQLQTPPFKSALRDTNEHKEEAKESLQGFNSLMEA